MTMQLENEDEEPLTLSQAKTRVINVNDSIESIKNSP